MEAYVYIYFIKGKGMHLFDNLTKCLKQSGESNNSPSEKNARK